MSEDAVKKLQAEAAADYAKHNSAETKAEAVIQSGLARMHGNEAAGTASGARQ